MPNKNFFDNMTQMEAAILYGVFQYCRNAAKHHGYYEPEFHDPNWFRHFQPRPRMGPPVPDGWPGFPPIPAMRFETELRFVSNEIIDYMPPTYIEGLKKSGEHVAKLVYEGLLLLQKREICVVADPDAPRPKIRMLTPEEAKEFREKMKDQPAPPPEEENEMPEELLMLPVEGSEPQNFPPPTPEQQARIDDKYENVRVDFKGRVFFQN